MATTTRIYTVTIPGRVRLIRASTPAQARNHVANELLSVKVAEPEECVTLGKQGVEIEEAKPE